MPVSTHLRLPSLRPSCRHIFSELLDILFPPSCGICRTHPILSQDLPICSPCFQRLPLIRSACCLLCGLPFAGHISNAFSCHHCRSLPLHFDCARSALTANPISLDLIHQFKYAGQTWLSRVFVGILMDVCASYLLSGGWEVIVAVPLHKRRYRERGYNQARELGLGISRVMGVPVIGGVIERGVVTSTQTGYGRRERFRNVRGVFEGGERLSEVGGKNVLLVDDVMTTGATASECGRILKVGGARSVGVVSVVRGRFR